MHLRPLLLFMGCLGFLSCKQTSTAFWTPDQSPQAIGKKVTADLLARPDFMMYKTTDVRAVHYAEVCTAFGAARLAGLEHDTATIARLSERYRKVLNQPIENTANHVDANVYGILPLELYRQNQDADFLKQGMDLADGQWADPLPNGLTSQTRFWIDDVWMIGALQIQAYRITGKTVYLDRAATEIAAYLEKLQQHNGLFFHGENAHFFWGRGNGWVAAGLAELISELPPNHPQYPAILAGYKKMMAALLKYQAPDGMWRQLVDVESAWEESSSTAMFGYAISVGVRRGILPAKKYRPAYQKAWLALVKHINEEGKLTDVCVGTGQSTDINFYLTRPKVTGDFHGQAPVLWLAYSLALLD